MTKEDALRAIYKGESTFYLINILGLAVTLLYSWQAVPGSPLTEAGSDPTIYVWTLIMILIGYGIGRTSRLMALLALFICVVSFAVLLVTYPTGPDPIGILLILLVFYFMVRAVKGSFAYHRLMKAEDPTYRATKIWHVLIGGPLTLLMLLTLVAAFALQTGIISDEDLEFEVPPPAATKN